MSHLAPKDPERVERLASLAGGVAALTEGYPAGVLFRAQVDSAHVIRHLIDTLADLLQGHGTFRFRRQGISLSQDTKIRDVTCIMELSSKHFQKYEFFIPDRDGAGLMITVNLASFYTECLRKIRKKDKIIIEICKEDTSLILRVSKFASDNQNSPTIAKIAVTEGLAEDIAPPVDYPHPVSIPSKLYLQSTRDLARANIKVFLLECINNRTIHIQSKRDKLTGVEAYFGDPLNDCPCLTYSGTITAKYLVKPAKLAATSDNIRIYATKDQPLLLEMNVGTLGELKIYLQSHEAMQELAAALAADDQKTEPEDD